MNILVVGDLVGKIGLNKLKKELLNLKEKNNIDFVIVNAENVAEGMGITEKDYKELLEMKIDAITMGNHTWARKEIFKIIDEPHIMRPGNYPSNVPGEGYRIFKCKNRKIAVINLLGRVSMNILTENPFLYADRIINKLKKEVDIIVVDFHSEATAEKKALGYYLDGKANVIFGTHTHIQTSDDQILPNGTAYITDVGMTGPKNSIIGMDINASLKRFLTALPEKYKMATGEAILNGCIFKINDENCKIEEIIRIEC